MFDYTAIDFETANAYRASPCSVGLVRVRDGLIVDERHWYIQPPQGCDHFDPRNIAIHNITQDMVAGAPDWNTTLPNIIEFIGQDTVIAHNAGFDINVIRAACYADNITYPELNFLCSLVLSRTILQLPSYTIPAVTTALDLLFENHHEALADAKVVTDIIQALAETTDAPDLQALAAGRACFGSLHPERGYKGSLSQKKPASRSRRH